MAKIPRGYFWYRLGVVLEIAVFLTPFLVMQMSGGTSQKLELSTPLAYQLFWLGTCSVAAMLLSGAMKIGEAARICLLVPTCSCRSLRCSPNPRMRCKGG